MASFFRRRDPWPSVVDRASASVVMLAVSLVRAWDGESPSASIGSGFVVDKKLGLILTCRSIISTGPIVGKAVFLNNEETKVSVVYVDPEHDFAFLRFDPKSVSYMNIWELPLYPEGARVGTDIRVIGCDAGEKLMVLDGTISDCKRMPPEFASGDEDASPYNDSNIFYITASSSVSAGSSGAPVVDRKGRAVALNTGGAEGAASSFFLPLHGVKRALMLLRKDLYAPIPRGTIQTNFYFVPMDHLKRLGLPPDGESVLRKANSQGSVAGGLVVGRTNVKGPGDIAGLRISDIVMGIDGFLVVDFRTLEELLDAKVGKSVTITVLRVDLLLNITVPVQDMMLSIVPTGFIEYSSAIIHPLSCILASMSQVPVNSVYVATPGFSLGRAGIGKDCIIEEIGGVKINNLDDFEKAMSALHDGERVTIKHFGLGKKHVKPVTTMLVDKRWYPYRRALNQSRTKGVESWTFRDCAKPTKPEPDKRRPSILQSRMVSFKMVDKMVEDWGDVGSFLQSIVWIECGSPYTIEGHNEMSASGCGIVVDTERGLLVCDRSTVMSPCGDITMIVASTFEIECKVVFFHPTLNFCFLKYDPTLITNTKLNAIRLFNSIETQESDLKRGDSLDFCGFTNQQHYHVMSGLKVVGLESTSMSVDGPPVFSARNFYRIEVDKSLGAAVGGILIDSQSRVRGIRGINPGGNLFNTHSTPVAVTLKHVQQAIDKGFSRIPPIGNFPVNLDSVQLSEARNDYGLPDEWVKKITEALLKDERGASQGVREVFKITRIMAGTALAEKDGSDDTEGNESDNEQDTEVKETEPGENSVPVIEEPKENQNILKSGDLLLAVNGEVATSYIKIDAVASGVDELVLTLLRDRQVKTINVKPVKMNCGGTRRVVSFAGMLLHETHPPVFFNGYSPPEFDAETRPGVYIAGICRGSPAEFFDVSPVTWLIEINSEPVSTLDDIINLVIGLKDGDSVRITTVDLYGDESVTVLETDFHYCETTDLVQDAATETWGLKVVEQVFG